MKNLIITGAAGQIGQVTVDTIDFLLVLET